MKTRISQNQTYLFVYGTLRKHGGSDFHQVLMEDAKYCGLGSYQGRLFKVTYYPGAIPSSDARDRVVGEIYKLKNDSKILRILDDYEECSSQHPLPHEYLRTQVRVESQDLGTISAWIYLYQRDTSALNLISSGDFLNPGD